MGITLWGGERVLWIPYRPWQRSRDGSVLLQGPQPFSILLDVACAWRSLARDPEVEIIQLLESERL